MQTVEHSADGYSFRPFALLLTGEIRILSATYGYHHPTPITGMNVYRIKHRRNGIWLYSNTVAVKTGNQPPVPVTPNPTNGNVTISSNGRELFVPFVLTVYDSKGSRLSQHIINKPIYSLDLSRLPAGLYFLISDGFSKKLRRINRIIANVGGLNDLFLLIYSNLILVRNS